MTQPGLPREALEDPFRPPEEPCLVRCLHCGQEYPSSRMIWRDGFWRCPVAGRKSVQKSCQPCRRVKLRKMGGPRRRAVAISPPEAGRAA